MKSIELEIADHPLARAKGLLGRASLQERTGLWLTNCRSVHTHFMRFPIDLIFIDAQHRVVECTPQVPAWRVKASSTASSVIELPAGTVQALQVENGFQLRLQQFFPRSGLHRPAIATAYFER